MSGFTAPASSEASVKPADLQGHLLIISPVEFKTGITTSLGEADAIEVNIVDLDTNEEHNSVLFFNVALKSALKPNIGKQVLARIGQGVAKPGKSAPWILVNATDNPGDVEKATAYLAGNLVAAAAATPTTEIAMTPEIQALINKLGAKPF
jgi:hypothetical protein